ncbi:hypothetical protein AcV5_002276 [Taiwanofungus camphoratus]|nr:hypothetical protein AcV5_002276 [Antrodia cinnamomea]KAI0944165.1 hypothetical protein AcV7_002067 [Antrodia cinnamomea]
MIVAFLSECRIYVDTRREMRMADAYTFMNMTHLHVKLLYTIHNVVVEFKTCDFRTLSVFSTGSAVASHLNFDAKKSSCSQEFVLVTVCTQNARNLRHGHPNCEA